MLKKSKMLKYMPTFIVMRLKNINETRKEQ